MPKPIAINDRYVYDIKLSIIRDEFPLNTRISQPRRYKPLNEEFDSVIPQYIEKEDKIVGY